MKIEESSTERYEGRVFEAKDNFGIETTTGKNRVSLYNPSDFVDKALSKFVNRNVEVEISIKITEKPSV